MSDALNEKALRARSYFQRPDEPVPSRLLVLSVALLLSLEVIAVVIVLTYRAEHRHPAPATSGYDTSWRIATTDGVPCRVGPGPIGHTEMLPDYPGIPAHASCVQLRPDGSGLDYE